MSKLFAIHAYDDMYGGLHGMETLMVIEACSFEEAEEIALDESYQVIDDYDDISNAFYNAAMEEDLEEDSDEFCNYIEALRDDDVAFEVHEIKKETSESLDVLSEKYYNGPDEFLAEYCYC